MTRALIPTQGFRWLKTAVPAPELGDVVVKYERVLQQRFLTVSGQECWFDVPEVNQENVQ